MTELMNQLINEPLVVIKIGLDKLAKYLEDQGVEVLWLDWCPPAGGDQEMIKLLNGLL